MHQKSDTYDNMDSWDFLCWEDINNDVSCLITIAFIEHSLGFDYA